MPTATLTTAKMQGIAMTTACLSRGRDQCAISSAMAIHMTENNGRRSEAPSVEGQAKHRRHDEERRPTPPKKQEDHRRQRRTGPPSPPRSASGWAIMAGERTWSACWAA